MPQPSRKKTKKVPNERRTRNKAIDQTMSGTELEVYSFPHEEEEYDDGLGERGEFELTKFCGKYNDAVFNDNKDEFLEIFLRYAGDRIYFRTKNGFFRRGFLEEICAARAVNCLEALLKDQNILKVNLNVRFKYGYYPLHVAASVFSLDLIEFLIHHGARTDLTTIGPQIDEALLPLNVAIENICLHKYLESWSPTEHSVWKLIILLCLPEMKMFLDSTRILAHHTEQVQTFDELVQYLNHGKLVHFTVLFMVAHPRIISTACIDKDGRSITGGMDFLSNYIDCAIFTQRLRWEHVHFPLFPAFYTLLQVFEKVGPDLYEYVQIDHSQVPREEIVEHVRSLLARECNMLLGKEIDLSDLDCDVVVNKQRGDNTSISCSESASSAQTTVSPLFDQNVSKRELELQWFERYIPRWECILNVKTSRFHVTPMYSSSNVNIGYDRANTAAKLPKKDVMLNGGTRVPVALSGSKFNRQFSTIAAPILKKVMRLI